MTPGGHDDHPHPGAVALLTPLWLAAPLCFALELGVPRMYGIRRDPAPDAKHYRTLLLTGLGVAWIAFGAAVQVMESSGFAAGNARWPLPVGIVLTIAVLVWKSAEAFHRAQTDTQRTTDASRLLESLETIYERLLPSLEQNKGDLSWSWTRQLLPSARQAVRDRAGADAVILVRDAAATLREAVGPNTVSEDVDALDAILANASRKLVSYQLRR